MLHMYFSGDTSRAQVKDRPFCGINSPCFAYRELLKEVLGPLFYSAQQHDGLMANNFDLLLSFIDGNLPVTCSLMKLPVLLLQF